jgi:small subunit ribosomal protein S20
VTGEPETHFVGETVMPYHKSAKKRMRQSEGRRAINRGNRTRVRSQIRKLRAALTGNAKELGKLLPATVSIIDKAVQKGALHKNAAARHKSRLTTAVNQAQSK